jgi:hypothetical protein
MLWREKIKLQSAQRDDSRTYCEKKRKTKMGTQQITHKATNVKSCAGL